LQRKIFFTILLEALAEGFGERIIIEATRKPKTGKRNTRRVHSPAFMDHRGLALEVLSRIQEAKGRLTPTQKGLAEYIRQNPESLAFLGVSELAKEAGVSQATIVRFAKVLGYEGYSSMSRCAQEALQVQLGTLGRFRLIRRLGREADESAALSTFERVVNQEIERLVNLSRNIRREDFYRCVDMMLRAHRIFIIGCMSDAVLAEYFGNMLSKVNESVSVMTAQEAVTPASCGRMNSSSLVFAVAFPRYPTETIRIARLAVEHGARLAVITDGAQFPLVHEAHLSFFLPVGIPSFVDAYASPVTLINALVTELSERNPAKTQRHLARYDACVSKTGVLITSGRKGNARKTHTGS
jgi:DNA-binding MurR/RpiR family transcriptional regulator